MLSIDIMLQFIKSENKFQSTLFKLNLKISVGLERTLGEGLMGVMVLVRQLCENEITIGKWYYVDRPRSTMTRTTLGWKNRKKYQYRNLGS